MPSSDRGADNEGTSEQNGDVGIECHGESQSGLSSDDVRSVCIYTSRKFGVQVTLEPEQMYMYFLMMMRLFAISRLVCDAWNTESVLYRTYVKERCTSCHSARWCPHVQWSTGKTVRAALNCVCLIQYSGMCRTLSALISCRQN